MGAIVKEDEDPAEKGSRHHCQSEGEPIRIAVADGPDHQGEQEEIRDEGGEQLANRDAGIGLDVWRGGLIPLRFVDFRDDENGIE